MPGCPYLCALDFEGRLSNIPAALVRAMREFAEEGRPLVKKSILLISDGVIDVNGDGHDQELEDWIREYFTEDATAAGIAIYGIALSEKAVFSLFHAFTRRSGNAFYPVFESREGVRFEDVFGAMQELKDAVGGRLVMPLKQVSFTDRRDERRYLLARSNNGVQINVSLPGETLQPTDLTSLTERVRAAFDTQGIDLSDEARIERVTNGRWEVTDPYRFTVSRHGRKLKLTPTEINEVEGLADLISAISPRSLWDNDADWVFFGVLLILLLYWLTVDVNVTAAHYFYRDRLSSAFLFRIAKDGTVDHNDKEKLSDLNSEGSAAPYHLINVVLNPPASKA